MLYYTEIEKILICFCAYIDTVHSYTKFIFDRYTVFLTVYWLFVCNCRALGETVMLLKLVWTLASVHTGCYCVWKRDFQSSVSSLKCLCQPGTKKPESSYNLFAVFKSNIGTLKPNYATQQCFPQFVRPFLFLLALRIKS